SISSGVPACTQAWNARSTPAPQQYVGGYMSGMYDVIDLLTFPSQIDFMQRAFLVTSMIAVPMAILSCFLVLKGWSLMGDAVSHAVFPGIVVAYIFSIPLAIGAFPAGMICALARSAEHTSELQSRENLVCRLL